MNRTHDEQNSLLRYKFKVAMNMDQITWGAPGVVKVTNPVLEYSFPLLPLQVAIGWPVLIPFLLDTGAAVTLLRKDTWERVNAGNQLSLQTYSAVLSQGKVENEALHMGVDY